MKKITLTCLSLGMMLYANAQQLLIDLNTGRTNTYPWSTAVTQPDDQWKVFYPGASAYGNALASTGYDPLLARNFQNIDSNVLVISPFVHLTADLPNNIHVGDLVNSVPVGNYIYRTQFNFDGTCKKVTSVILHINKLTASNEVTDLMINGNIISINSTNLAMEDAYTATIPGSGITPLGSYDIPVYYADIVNGLNSIHIEVEVTSDHHTWTAGLMVDASLEINYAPLVPVFNLTGTTMPPCSGQPGYIDATVGAGQTPSNYSLVITDPSAATAYSGAVPASVTIYQAGTYNLTLTDNVCSTTASTTYAVNYPRHCPPLRKANEQGISTSVISSEYISISPNPSKDVFSVNITEGESGLMRLYDVAGNLIKKVELNGIDSEYKIDLSGFANGIYMLNVDSDSGHLTKKIIHQE